MARPDDPHPRSAIDGAEAFAESGNRTAALRRLAWAAHKAARDVSAPAATDAAFSAMHAAGAAFLHPLYSHHQVKHILGSAVHQLLALECAEPGAVAQQREWVRCRADNTVRSVLKRFPEPVGGRTAFSRISAQLDAELRR